MREHADEITRHDVRIIAITPAEGALVAKYVEAFGPYPFSVFGDPQQHAFAGLGHQHMPKWKLLGMAVIGILGSALKGKRKGKEGFFPQQADQKEVVLTSMKTSDIYQQGGTWLFDRHGTALWKHIDETPGDHATIAQILTRIA